MALGTTVDFAIAGEAEAAASSVKVAVRESFKPTIATAEATTEIALSLSLSLLLRNLLCLPLLMVGFLSCFLLRRIFRMHMFFFFFSSAVLVLGNSAYLPIKSKVE